MRTILVASMLALSTLALAGCASGARDSHDVVYSITSDGTSSTSISYVTVAGADVSLAQVSETALPWTKKLNVVDGALSDGILSVAGQLGEDGTTITCDISVDGRSVASETSSGQFAAVTCSGSNQP